MHTFLKPLLLSVGLLLSAQLFSQTAPFELALEPVSIPGLGGIQSYAFGQANGKWLIIGGRLDGLHRRQPFAAFDVAGHNNQLIVVDPVNLQKWSAPLSSLPTGIQEQLSATNMEFIQLDDYLYCLGGYGYSSTLGDHTTYAQLTAIKVPDVIDAIVNNNSFTGYFRQISDPQFQVTGGQMGQINDHLYLMGGQKFLGRYNPMGPTHGPGFIQEYTDAIRIFDLADNGTTLTINHLPSYYDSTNLHRRDFNAMPQILPDGSQGITMFSGVFQPVIDLPYLNAVTIDSTGYSVEPSFEQLYNHYHCPTLSLYSASNNEMHTVFFGGIAQFYDNAGTLIQDDDVPFVPTIAQVSRAPSGTITEYKLPIEMPALLGAGAEFIPNQNNPQFDNEVFKLDSLPPDSTLIGYIYGGISSSQQNIFFTNDGTQSSASSQLFKVWIMGNVTTSALPQNPFPTNGLNLSIYPNPTMGLLHIAFDLPQEEDVKISIYNLEGMLLETSSLVHQPPGKLRFTRELKGLMQGNAFLIRIETSQWNVTRKVVVED